MPRVFLALGSNVDAEANLKAAAEMLRDKWPSARFSRVYRTAPVGYENQEDFLNAVADVETDSSPKQVHDHLIRIESALVKAPPFKNGPRTIDLDLLLYDDLVRKNENLVIPHPRMHKRRFVLKPLVELIDGSEMHPALRKSWNKLLEALPPERIEPWSVVL